MPYSGSQGSSGRNDRDQGRYKNSQGRERSRGRYNGGGKQPFVSNGRRPRPNIKDEHERKPRLVAPELDTDITGEELDRTTLKQVRSLEASNAESVCKHLVMVGRYLFEAPEFALEHARYAVSRAGRVAAVREAAAVAAYESGQFHEALKEFRTYRRMTGDQSHLPLMVDCERALGKPDKALELAASPEASELNAQAAVELAIVVSGIRHDQGDLAGALNALEIPQLDRRRGFTYSPRLFRAYAEALKAMGRAQEAQAWDRQAVVAEAALGMGQFSEPEIFDLIDDETEREEGVELESEESSILENIIATEEPHT